jgi:hypothetical protein
MGEFLENDTSYNILGINREFYNRVCEIYGIVNNYKNMLFIPIYQVIENNDDIVLCDITVQKNENYIASNILVHNSEGLDIPDLNTEILTTSVSDIQQSSGRILRKYHEEIDPMIVDIVDNCGNFINQWKQRQKYYKSENYIISQRTIDIDCFDKNDRVLQGLSTPLKKIVKKPGCLI